MIDKKEEDVTRVLQAVNKIDLDDKTDRIIAKRIENDCIDDVCMKKSIGSEIPDYSNRKKSFFLGK